MNKKVLMGLAALCLWETSAAYGRDYRVDRAEGRQSGPSVCVERKIPTHLPPPPPVYLVPVGATHYRECIQYRTLHQWVPQGSQVTYFVPDYVDFR